MLTAKRNHDPPLRRLSSPWEPQSTLLCNAAPLWRNRDWRCNGGESRHDTNQSRCDSCSRRSDPWLCIQTSKRLRQTEIQKSQTYCTVSVKKQMTSSRARRLWIKYLKLALLIRDQYTNVYNLKDLRNLEHVSNWFLNISMEIASGNWSLRAKRALE